MADNYDVIVVGGGPAGFGAAVAAGRQGRDVLLVEATEQLGGAGTTALVNNFCNAYWDGERFIIDGIFGELRHRLIGRKAIWTTRGPNTADKVGQEVYDPDVYADEMERMCRQAGVDVRYGARCTDGTFEDERAALVVDGESVAGRTVVDATGDAVLAHHAGVPTEIGRGRGEIQPLTYCYMFGPVDLASLGATYPTAIQYDENVDVEYGVPSYVEEICELVREDVAAGALDLSVPTLYATVSVPGREAYMTTNFGHVQIDDPTDPEQLEWATAEGKRQMHEGIRWFRERLPGFEEVEVVCEPDGIGVRESRQIEGLYTLEAADVAGRRQFDDVIAQCCFNIDVHQADVDVDHSYGVDGLGEHDHYDIPWRALVPASGPPNLIVAGRSISATSVAMSSFRVSPSVMAIGEAAGVTAAIACECDQPIAAVDVAAVQDRLRQAGAVLS